MNVYESNLCVKAQLQQKRNLKDLPYFCFQVKLIFNGSARGICMIASKSLLLKHKEDSTQHGEHCLCTQSLLKKKVFEQLKLAVACSARRRPASGEVLISECDATWRTVKVDSYCLLTRYLT